MGNITFHRKLCNEQAIQTQLWRKLTLNWSWTTVDVKSFTVKLDPQFALEKNNGVTQQTSLSFEPSVTVSFIARYSLMKLKWCLEGSAWVVKIAVALVYDLVLTRAEPGMTAICVRSWCSGDSLGLHTHFSSLCVWGKGNFTSSHSILWRYFHLIFS